MNLICKNWTYDLYQQYTDFLKSKCDEQYRVFHLRLVKDSRYQIIGIRVPEMKKIAKEICKGDALSFIQLCGDSFYEEVMIKGLVIGSLKLDYDDLIPLVKSYLNLIDNWAICDGFCSNLKIVRKYKAKFWEYINECIKSDNPWYIRTGIILMLSYYLDSDYIKLVLKRCDNIKNDHYYVKMAQAWLIATAYAKFEDITHSYLLKSNLDNWTFNKAIQKARESFRIDEKSKQSINSLKRA